MHIRAILAIARKDALDILLNKLTLSLVLCTLLFTVLFSVISGLFGSLGTTNILIYNPGHAGIERVINTVYANSNITYARSAAEVTDAFGPNGAHKASSYDAGLVVPFDFDGSLRAGGHPQFVVYTNGDKMSQTESQQFVTMLDNYARSVANPQSPENLARTAINPPATLDLSSGMRIYFGMYVLVLALLMGVSFVPLLLVEEKEKKTLRLLMVSPSSLFDVVMAKLLVALGYEFVLAVVVIVVFGSLAGQVVPLLLFIVLGACFSVTLGLFVGSLLKTVGSVSIFTGLATFLFVVPVLFVSPFSAIAQLQSSPLGQFAKAIPVYYLAEGILATQIHQNTANTILVDVLVLVGSILILLVAAVWILRRQAVTLGAL